MWFDPFLQAGSLRARDVEDLRLFGVSGALVPSGEAAPATAAGVRRGWAEVLRTVRRLRRSGLAEAVIARVCGGNALAFLGLERTPSR